VAGTAVTFTAQGQGGSGNYEYRFWLLGPSTGGLWVSQQAYSATNTWSWNTTSADIGTSTIAVWVHNVGSPTSTWDVYALVNFDVN